jgi:hypothetical protein
MQDLPVGKLLSAPRNMMLSNVLNFQLFFSHLVLAAATVSTQIEGYLHDPEPGPFAMRARCGDDLRRF